MRVRPVLPGEIDAVAGVLGRSFETDPFAVWLFGPRAAEPMRRLFRAQLRVQYVDRGRAYTVDGLSGAALWSPPGRSRPSFRESLRLTFPSLLALGPRRVGKATKAFGVIESNHPDEPHRYLAVLGVDPARQRSGVGRSLIEAVAASDPAEVPLYLDTSNPDNVPYYRQHGFEVTTEFEIPGGGPTMWGMLRRAAHT